MKTEKLFKNGSQFIEISKAMCVDNGQIWLIETNIDFSTLPLSFRKKIKLINQQETEDLHQEVSAWAKLNSFSETTQQDYTCTIERERIATYEQQWHHPKNISTWAILVSASNEQEAKEIAFKKIAPIGAAKNSSEKIEPFTPLWINSKKIKNNGVNCPPI